MLGMSLHPPGWAPAGLCLVQGSRGNPLPVPQAPQPPKSSISPVSWRHLLSRQVDSKMGNSGGRQGWVIPRHSSEGP